jgi:hypothetical protein
LCAPNAIGVRIQRASAVSERQVDGAHLLAPQFVQEISACLAKDFVRYCLDFGATIGVQGQKGTSIKINGVNRSSVRSQKNGLLLEAPFDCVATRAFGKGRNRYHSPARKVRLNEVNAMLRGARSAADREANCFGER